MQFNSTDLSNPTLIVGNTFHNAIEFKKAVRLKDLLWQTAASYKKTEIYRVMDEKKRIVRMLMPNWRRLTPTHGVGASSIQMPSLASYTTISVRDSILG
jgi:hypothetical protein